MVLEKIHILTCSFFLNCVSVSSSYMNDVYYNFVCRVLLYVRHLTLHTYILYNTSVDTEMCCPKGKCGCQYFILLTLKKYFISINSFFNTVSVSRYNRPITVTRDPD
jgi:hypothetical protein